MKYVWIVLNDSPKLINAPYTKRMMVFENEDAMLEYVKSCHPTGGWQPELEGRMRDVGMLNQYNMDGIDISFIKVEVK